jgi:hypothetical protein
VQEQAAVMQAVGSAEYGALKDRLLLTTAAMGAGGSALAAALAGPDVALPFAIGGAAGLLYQWLLQQGADSLGGEPQQQQPAYSGAMQVRARGHLRQPRVAGMRIGHGTSRWAAVEAACAAPQTGVAFGTSAVASHLAGR